MENTENREEKAIRLVHENFNDKVSLRSNLKLVWFCKTLKNWKAMVADVSEGGAFFEVTYNGDKNETYIDHYEKLQNVRISD